MNIKKITEAKDVELYKRLLEVFGNYMSIFPCTGVDILFDNLVAHGKKLLPKNGQALKILDHIISLTDEPGIVQKLLNMRFSDLPVEIRPVAKNGEIVYWERNGNTSDRIRDLVDFVDTGGQGRWSDSKGQKITLVGIDYNECILR